MSIVGFNFTKMTVEKKRKASGKINISNNVSVKNVKEAKLSFGATKQSGLEFIFEFKSKYEPDVGSIELIGQVIYMDKEEVVREVLESWKKHHKVPKQVLGKIYNTILTKSNIEALILSRDINLPPPIPLPKVKQE